MTPSEPTETVGPDRLNEKLNPDDIKTIVRRQKANLKFGDTRKLLARVVNLTDPQDPHWVWYQQQLALCTYKDEALLPADRLNKALNILEGIGLRHPQTTDAETLALGGAVYKRLWDYRGQLENLYDALFFYRAAFERNPDQDLGYGGINAAYVLELLAARTRVVEKRSAMTTAEAVAFAAQANDLRQKIVAQLASVIDRDPSMAETHWLTVTLAEAHFGLGAYEDAGRWLERSTRLDDTEWKRQTTFRQLVSIARLQGIELPAEGSEVATWHGAWQALTNLLGGDTATALSCYRGKVGLALSGGGFRASLYHLGVLARLAEMDVLRSVETLSTVSGGSIVGAHYYLEVKHLLERKADADIGRQDYIDVVRRVKNDFLQGVAMNIRTRMLADIRHTLRMIFSKHYSRSHRLGELYESKLYARIEDGHPPDRPRAMRDLLIRPKGATKGFHPKFNNWRRRAKVPALLLNATSLNTGHNWRFTARSMGEPPGLLGSEVDKNTRYRRLWYDQAPSEALQHYRLGYAVAASACVPGLFEPLKLDGLYPGKVVQLVDGGVHDNQGVAGLLDEGCTVVLCSDAAGQMADMDAPSNGLPAVLMRANAVMMDRVREAEYQDVRSRADSRALQGLFFVHLKKDLHVCPQDWIGCQDPTPVADKSTDPPPYGIDAGLQKLIAGIRTDLDSFSEVEASALMCAGYLMTEQQFSSLQEHHERSGETGMWGGYRVDAPREAWDFLQLAPILENPNDAGVAGEDLRRQLKAAGSLLFKIWQLDPRLKGIAWTAGLASAALAVVMVKVYWSRIAFSVELTVGALTLALVLFVAVLRFPVIAWLFPQKATRGMIRKTFAGLFGYLAAKLHLSFFDKLFLKRGALKRLLNLRNR